MMEMKEMRVEKLRRLQMMIKLGLEIVNRIRRRRKEKKGEKEIR